MVEFCFKLDLWYKKINWISWIKFKAKYMILTENFINWISITSRLDSSSDSQEFDKISKTRLNKWIRFLRKCLLILFVFCVQICLWRASCQDYLPFSFSPFLNSSFQSAIQVHVLHKQKNNNRKSTWNTSDHN